MLRATFLGTAASRPTVGRNVSSIAVQREGEILLFDCGEGTQRQMMRYQTGFGIWGIFVTHLHADHFLGVIGLLRTLSLQDRTDPIHLYAPRGGGRTLEAAVKLGVDFVTFPVEVHELAPGERAERDGYHVEAVEVRHRGPSVGWALREPPRPGRFDVDRARELGVPEGPLFGRLHRGEAVEVEGRTVDPSEVVGPDRPGRSLLYTGDTRPADVVIEAARGTDLLIHEATFSDEEADRARKTYHSTAREAAEVARKADVRRLALTHLSARYSDNPGILRKEAREVFPDTVVARDGLVIEIPFLDGVGSRDQDERGVPRGDEHEGGDEVET